MKGWYPLNEKVERAPGQVWTRVMIFLKRWQGGRIQIQITCRILVLKTVASPDLEARACGRVRKDFFLHLPPFPRNSTPDLALS